MKTVLFAIACLIVTLSSPQVRAGTAIGSAAANPAESAREFNIE